MSNLSAAHRGYEYQDLLIACRLVDMLLGNVIHIHVDEKLFDHDRFDDLTSSYVTGIRERVQFKHTDNDDRPLTLQTFTLDDRSLRLDRIIAAMLTDFSTYGCMARTCTYRIVLRDQPPNDTKLTSVLKPIRNDPGPFIPAMRTQRFTFDTETLWTQRENGHDSTSENQFAFLFTGDTPLTYDKLKWACEHLVIEVGAPSASADLTTPSLAEQLLLVRVRTEVGAESFPNNNRSAIDVAAAIISTARAARQGRLVPTADEILRRAQLRSDFGAVSRAHPVDRNIEVLRPAFVQQLVEVATELASTGGYLLVEGPPGHGKSWVCQQLLETLSNDGWLNAEHYCYLGDADGERRERVFEEHVFGSLVGRLAEADPRLVMDQRPRFTADEDTLVGCLRRSHEQEPTRRVALIVDGIDHITRVRRGEAFDPSRSLAESLSSLELPPGTVIIILSQPGPHLAPLEEAGAKSILIPGFDDLELRSLAGLLNIIPSDDHKQLANFPPLIQETEAVSEFLDALTERSGRNALYATYLCRETRRCCETTVNPGAAIWNFPPFDGTLKNYYDYLYHALGPKAGWVADIIALVDFAVTRTELYEIMPDRAHYVDGALAVLEPVLIERATQGGVRVYHESFARYLRGLFDSNTAVVKSLLEHIAIWLNKKGIFTDPRAFRSLLSILAEAGQDRQVVDIVDRAFVNQAVASCFPASGINANLATAIGSAARLGDWPLVLRYVELSRAAYSYQSERYDSTLVAFADIPASLIGVDNLAARLIDDDRLVMPARAGLQMCAAVDKLGATAPWHVYMEGFLREAETDNTSYGEESDRAVALAWLRGRLRLASTDSETTFKTHSKSGVGETKSSDAKGDGSDKKWDPTAQIDWTRLAHWIEYRDLPEADVVSILEDTHGLTAVLQLISSLNHPGEICLALAERLASGPAVDIDIGSPQCWATKAVTYGAPIGSAHRLMKLGLTPEGLTRDSISSERERLFVLTRHIQERSVRWEEGLIGQWLDTCTLAAYRDPLGLNSAEALITGEGWYRCWLRFVIGLSRAEAAGVSERGSLALDALGLLTGDLYPFSGDPRACDLYPLHGVIRDTISRAMDMLHDDQWQKGLDILKEVSASITTTIRGELGGPVPPDLLLHVAVRGANQTRHSIAVAFAEDVIATRSAGRFYADLAEYRLYAARLAIAGEDKQRAHALWQEACTFLTAYGWHKDITIYEVLDPFPVLIKADPSRARARVAALQGLCNRVPLHTDGKETRHARSRWWELLSEADPVGAVYLAVPQLLSECNDPNWLLNGALVDIWQKWNEQVDPLLSGALRLTLDMSLNSADIKQLERLVNDSDGDSPVIQQLMTWLLARADERPLGYSYSNSSELVAKDDQEVAKLNELAEAATLPPVRAFSEDTTLFSEQPRRIDAPTKPVPPIARVNDLEKEEFPQGLPGLARAIRLWRRRPYDSQSPEYTVERFANIIGYRLLILATDGRYQEAVSALRMLAESDFGQHSSILRLVAEGLERHDETQLAVIAYTLAWTHARGHGGWLTFGGETEIDALQRASSLDSQLTLEVVAEDIGRMVATSRYGTNGISQAIIYAFSVGALICTDKPSIDLAFAAWDEAFAIIDARAPVVAPSDNPEPAYQPPDPDNGEPLTGNLETAIALAVLGGLADPGRENKRRGFLASQLLLNECATIAAHAFDIALGTISDPATLTWLLRLIELSGEKNVPVLTVCQDTLRDLSSRDLITVRTLARRLLIGNLPPLAPPAPVHPGLLDESGKTLLGPDRADADSNDKQEEIDGLIESFAGVRLKQGERFLPGLKRAVREYFVASINDEHTKERLEAQLRAFADRLRKRWPDAFLVQGEKIEEALQTIAAGGRAARFTVGELVINPVEWEDKLASTLLNDPSVPLILEATRQPRPNIIPPPGRGGKVWMHISDRINNGLSSVVEEASCESNIVLATIKIEPASSSPVVEGGAFKGWRWFATMEKRLLEHSKERRESFLTAKRYRALEVRNVDDRQAFIFPPTTSGDMRMWALNVDPILEAPLFRKSQPLVGEDHELEVVGDGHLGLGVPDSLLVPTASVIVLLKLHPGAPYSYEDENGPALSLVTWRAEYDTSEYYLAWPRTCGSGIVIRPDLLDRLVSYVGESRLVLRDFVMGEIKLLEVNTA